MVCTIFDKTEGDVEVFDYKLGKDDDKIRENIGIVFQNSVLKMESAGKKIFNILL